MGYDKDQVFDVEEHTEATSVDPVIDTMIRLMDADRWFAKAQWYAMGRMYCEPAVLKTASGEPDEAGTAAGFGYAYQRMMIQFRDRERTEAVPLHHAWANYVASVGGTVDA